MTAVELVNKIWEPEMTEPEAISVIENYRTQIWNDFVLVLEKHSEHDPHSIPRKDGTTDAVIRCTDRFRKDLNKARRNLE